MAAAKKAASKTAEKSAPATEQKVVSYVPAGAVVNATRAEPTIDPELEKIRDAEAKANDVPVHPMPDEPTIDDELVKARDAEIKKAEKFNQANK